MLISALLLRSFRIGSNNLAAILLLQNKLEEARKALAEAWSLEAGKADLTSSRILFMRLSAAFLESQPYGVYVGQLKTLLAIDELPDHANVAKVWDIDYYITYLCTKLSESEAEILTAIAAAMNDRAKVPALDTFALWTSQPPIPLDGPWPDNVKATAQAI